MAPVPRDTERVYDQEGVSCQLGLHPQIQVQALKNAIKWKYKNVIPSSDHLQALKNAIKLQILDAKFPTW